MKIKQETIVKLFEALGFKTASNWNEKELQKKIKKLPEIVDGKTIKSPNVRKALKKILDADTVEIDMSAVEVAPEPETEMEPEKKTKKVVEKSAVKKKTEGKIGEKELSNKQVVYSLFQKVKPENALGNAEKWWETINKKVKLTTIKGWISMWKNGKGLPKPVKT